LFVAEHRIQVCLGFFSAAFADALLPLQQNRQQQMLRLCCLVGNSFMLYHSLFCRVCVVILF